MNVLMLAYYFPPDASSGAFRPLYFAKYLEKEGENVFVLTAREEDFLESQPRDHNLLEKVSHVEVIRNKVFRPREALISLRDRFARTPRQSEQKSAKIRNKVNSTPHKSDNLFQKAKDFVTFSLSSPDPHIGWLPAAVHSGLKQIKKNRIDVIYATGSPWTCFIIGSILKIISKTPLVLDFRDPWASNPGFRVRPSFFRSLEKSMEKFVVRKADLIIANTKQLEQDFIEKYNLNQSKICTITNGFEEYQPTASSDKQRFTLTHAGSLYFSRNPKNLLKAILLLMDEKLLNEDNFLIHFIGGISIDDPELQNILTDSKCRQVVKITSRVPFQEVCKYQTQSDALFLIQTDFPLQVPRKLYENMAFKKPVLAITNKKGATATIVKTEKIGIVVEDRVQEIANALRELVADWQTGNNSQEFNTPCDNYLNINLSSLFHQKLKKLIVHGK